MTSKHILFTEHCGQHQAEYTKKEPLRIERLVPKSTVSYNVYRSLLSFFQEVLLPYGYPDSVSSDYFEYQVWDTLQAFCSTITGSFTTRAILRGVGVGNAEASALSATITWIMKDGSGMIGRILFAWWKGSKLDCDSKKWRLFADFLNDIAMAIELAVPYVSSRSMEILCVTSTMKSIVGIAGGATRASITNHQAVNGNMAEISAKDGTQETLVNLIASISSIYLLSLIVNPSYELPFILVMMLFHLYFNYRAVGCLVFDSLNQGRMVLLMKSYCNLNTVLRPAIINAREPVILGTGKNISDLCEFNIKLGCSLVRIVKLYNFIEMEQLLELYKNEQYIVVSDIEKSCIYVGFEKTCDNRSVLIGYFHAVMLAIATSIYNDLPLDVNAKRQRNHSNPVARIATFMSTIERVTTNQSNLNIEELKMFNAFLKPEINMFLTSLIVNGWDVNKHSFYMDQWKIEWESTKDKNE